MALAPEVRADVQAKYQRAQADLAEALTSGNHAMAAHSSEQVREMQRIASVNDDPPLS